MVCGYPCSRKPPFFLFDRLENKPTMGVPRECLGGPLWLRVLRSLWSTSRHVSSKLQERKFPILISQWLVQSPNYCSHNRPLYFHPMICSAKDYQRSSSTVFLPIPPLSMASPWQSCARSWSWSCTKMARIFRGQPPKILFSTWFQHLFMGKNEHRHI